MRRSIAIAFLLIFLLNVAGCYGIFWMLLERANIALNNKLDSQAYHEDETVLIKVPVALPYSTDDTDYKRVDGTFKHQGEFYKLVKQKMQQDTLYVVCIRDVDKKEIINLVNDFVKSSHDNQATSKTLKLLGSVMKEFSGFTATEIISTARWAQNRPLCTAPPEHFFYIKNIPSPPPKSLSCIA